MMANRLWWQLAVGSVRMTQRNVIPKMRGKKVLNVCEGDKGNETQEELVTMD